MSVYKLDGQVISKADLIEKAQALGYYDPDDLYFPSIAALYLCRAGHTVEFNPPMPAAVS